MPGGAKYGGLFLGEGGCPAVLVCRGFRGSTCDQCVYEAKSKAHLKGHIESTHGEVRYPCVQCDYKAKWQAHSQKGIQILFIKLCW